MVRFLKMGKIEWRIGLVGLLAAAWMLSAAADARTETTFVVQDCPGYNGWPFIRVLDGRLLVVYNRANGHEFTDGKVDLFARQSADRARTWTDETAIEACGRLSSEPKGTPAFCWNRFWKGNVRRHDLYRTFDGVRFEKVSTPALDPMPVQVMAPVPLPDGRLLSLWFDGDYRNLAGGHSWGTLFSSDGGRTWRQKTVEAGLSKADWPTEPSVVSLGGGRLLAIARAEWCEGADVRQLQSLTSSDGGLTWTRAKTAIADVHESTPALLYDGASDELTLYYFHRGPGVLKRRTAKASAAFADPLAWSESEVVACGRKRRAWDSGNVSAVRLDGSDYLAYYAGDATNATVLVSVVGKAESPAGSWEGRRVLFLGAWDAAQVRETAHHKRFEAKVYPTADDAFADYPAEAFWAIVLRDGATDAGVRRFPNARILTESGFKKEIGQ